MTKQVRICRRLCCAASDNGSSGNVSIARVGVGDVVMVKWSSNFAVRRSESPRAARRARGSGPGLIVLAGRRRQKVVHVFLGVAVIAPVTSLSSAPSAFAAASAASAVWTVSMPDSTQPISTPSGGVLGVACYSTSSSLAPLVDLEGSGATIWSAPAAADADPCAGSAKTGIAAGDGSVYAVISTPTATLLRAYSPLGAVKWTVPLDGVPFRTDRMALGWNGSVFVQLSDGRNALVEGFSEATGKRTFDVSEYDGDGIYPYPDGIALAQPQGAEYYNYQGALIGSTQLTALSSYEAYSAAGGANGAVFLAGWEGSCGSNKFSVSKVTPTGLAWTKTDAAQTVCGQTALSATPDGGVVLAWNQGVGSWLYRSYSGTGAVRWTESPPGTPANAVGQGGYIAPIVDQAGNIGLPYEYSYTCANPSLTCRAFQIDFVTEASGTEKLPPAVQEDPPDDVQLDGADVGPGHLYVGATTYDQATGTGASAIEGFALPGLALSYRVSLEPSVTIKGSVACAGGKRVDGVWIQSSGGGSKLSRFSRTSSSTATYSASILTAIPTTISLHVGCGGSTGNWASDNWTPYTSAISAPATINAMSCSGGICTWNRADSAARWASAQTVGPECKKWSGLCLAFVYHAYVQGAGITAPVPSVYGPNATALDEYYCYSGQRSKIADGPLGVKTCPSRNLIKTSWQHENSSGQVVIDTAPPRGAWVFYPGLTSQGHIAISLGGGKVVTADEFRNSAGCYVKVTHYNSIGGKSSYYVGWAFPYSASH